MLLSDRDLKAAIKSGVLGVNPLDPARIQPASIDVLLADTFRVFHSHRHTHIDPRRPQPELAEKVRTHPGDPFILHPGEFALGSTVETVRLGPEHAADIAGKSSLGRLGLLVHATAGFVDPGFHGQITLELSNVATLPILLWPGDPIGQLRVYPLSSPCERPYGTPGLGSRYQGQSGPTPSRTHNTLEGNVA